MMRPHRKQSVGRVAPFVAAVAFSGFGLCFASSPQSWPWSASAQALGVGETEVRNGAPPVVICGQTLYPAGPVGALTKAFTLPGSYKLSGALQMGSGRVPEILDFVASCRAGVSLTFKPRGDLTIYSEARAEDHKLAAIAIDPHRAGVVQIIVTRPRGQRTVVVVRVRPPSRDDHGNRIET
jgi:hypothetical protein